MAKVLIVEDDSQVRATLERLLKRDGHQCLTAVDADGARQALAQTSVDLVLLDIGLPGESGLALGRSIRTSAPDTAIVMVTGHYDPSEATLALQNGAFGYILKPFKANELSINVDAALRRRILEIGDREQAAALRRSNEDLEQFAYVASHDLQGPLRKISNYAALLKRRYEGKLDADADDFIAYIVAGAQRMESLIDDLLKFSRAARQDSPTDPIDSNVALDMALANLQGVIESKQAVVTRGPLPRVLADQSRLSEVFQNLVDNGIKFCAQSHPEVHVGAERQDDHWLFSVRDKGIGIEPQYRDRIFQIFQRLHTQDEYPGTGMGLAVCRKIVERTGGRIWMESEPGKGSIFYFTLPGPAERAEAA